MLISNIQPLASCIINNRTVKERMWVLKQTIRSLQLECWHIHFVCHRNHNQHRKTHWWCQFNIFKRCIKRILEYINDNVHNKSNNHTNLQNIVQGRCCQNLTWKFFKVPITVLYIVNFKMFWQLGQFVTLAVVLIGLLAKCHSLLLQLRSKSEYDET